MAIQHWNTRAENNTDTPAVYEIIHAAFAQRDEADLVDALRADPAWIDGLSLVATDDNGTVIAHALLTRNHIGDQPALCLAPCSVRPDHQRTGAGTAVIRAALRAAAEQGERFVTVLGHPEYYPRFGFRPASRYGIRMSVDVPDDALLVLALHGDPLPSGIIRYAAPFGV
ncbi:N-acetyltransferase [Nocardia sp. 2]|uniref:N-acetyltransferase n=1 Tax=Nocardia acididurans TaxID=2802282 RepID=A0ABS1M8H9_9NOCA|nr:N-acetyltransferase [Nocardia acididurans]MBL1076957.1 N-acetyltransferase [Nocardia acididurans]